MDDQIREKRLAQPVGINEVVFVLAYGRGLQSQFLA